MAIITNESTLERRIAELEQRAVTLQRDALDPFPMGSALVRPGETAQMTSRPQRGPFQIHRIEIEERSIFGDDLDTLAVWLDAQIRLREVAEQNGKATAAAVERIAFDVESPGAWRPARSFTAIDLRIGNRSQFAQSGEIPAATIHRNPIRTEIVQVAMDVVWVLRNDAALPFHVSISGFGITGGR